MPGKVSLKKRLVDGDVLEPDDPLLLLDLEDPIHEQEGITMRQNFHDVFYRVHPFLLSARLDHLTYQRHRATMARLHRDNAGANPSARERQIAHTVHSLVTHELVRPTQIAAQNVGVVEHHRVL